MSSQTDSSLSGQLDRVLAEHRAGHFNKARQLLTAIRPDAAAGSDSEPEQKRLRELRERFQPDRFAWLMLLGGLLLLVAIVAMTWR